MAPTAAAPRIARFTRALAQLPTQLAPFVGRQTHALPWRRRADLIAASATRPGVEARPVDRPPGRELITGGHRAAQAGVRMTTVPPIPGLLAQFTPQALPLAGLQAHPLGVGPGQPTTGQSDRVPPQQRSQGRTADQGDPGQNPHALCPTALRPMPAHCPIRSLHPPVSAPRMEAATAAIVGRSSQTAALPTVMLCNIG